MMATRCRGFSIEPGQYSGCKGWEDCPVCEGHGVEPLRLNALLWSVGTEELHGYSVEEISIHVVVYAEPEDRTAEITLWPEDESSDVFSGVLYSYGREWLGYMPKRVTFRPHLTVRVTPDLNPRRPDIMGHLCDSPVIVLAGEAAPDGSVFPADVLWGRIRITEEN